MAIPPAATTGRPTTEDLLEQLDVRARERPVAPRARHEQPLDPGRRAAPRKLGGAELRVLQPAVDGHEPVACIHGDDERGGAEALDRRRQERVVERGGADEHPRGSGCQRRVDQLEAAVAASHLHGNADGGNALEETQIRLAGEGAVEIDEMEPGRAFGDEPLGGRDRVAALDRHVLAPALGEADDASREHVERRIDGEVLAR